MSRSYSLPALRVLLVDDQHDRRADLKQRIEALGIRAIHEVDSGGEAIGLLHGHSFKIDLVITDLAMEPFDGFHLIRTLRGSRDLQDTRILVVTGLSDDEIAARGGLDEATLCYAKPLSFQRLHGYIDALVQRRSVG